MPPPDRAALLDAAGALGVTLDGRQADQLLTYLALLQKWNQKINLTAIRDPAAMLTHHLLDCLAVVAPLRRHGAPRRLLDCGSGAGLPGLVIAVALPEVLVTCVDAVGKKAAFVGQAVAEIGLANAAARHGRVEAIEAQFDVVTARAFTSLAGLVSLTHRQLADGGVWLAMKGRVPDDEIAALPADVAAFHVERLEVPGMDERCIVWMQRVSCQPAHTHMTEARAE